MREAHLRPPAREFVNSCSKEQEFAFALGNQTAMKCWPKLFAAELSDEWRDKIQSTHQLTCPKA